MGRERRRGGASVAFLGATRGMGRALSRRMAERGDRVFLLGRDEQELERACRDLEVRAGGAPSDFAACDLARPETFAPALEEARRSLGRLDVVVVTAGMFATQERLESDVDLAEALLTVDFTNTVLFCEHARRMLLSQGGGTLCVFSSVAGERGRKPIVLYGAAKAGLSRYLEGLDHRHRGEGLRVVCVKPGFVHTAMTAGLRAPPFAGEPGEVADRVLAAIDRGDAEVYAPAAWGPIMRVVRALPRFVMRRAGF
jgi:decaprenylphospho-beta-D-erythro-pentofuranosid-2-ulose 2-reductase